jgi:hypothetical protein
VARETALAASKNALAARLVDTEEADEKKAALEAAAAATARADRFGVELVLSVGLYYSFVLLLIYLPTHASITAAGRSIRDREYPLPLPNHPEYEARKKQHDAMNELLQLNVGAASALKPATLVLIPLVSSLASTLLGGVKVGVG